MKRLLPIALIIIVGALFIFSAAAKYSTRFNSGGPNYHDQWAKVDSLERKGLFKMALTEVGLIFEDATKNGNHNQVIKSVLYELKYNAYLEEDDYVLGIYRLDELVAKATSPSKEILHSLIAEVYWGYYSANSWKFIDRTNVVGVEIKDIRTWDLKRIAEKVRYHYFMSLQNPEVSQMRLINDYSEIADYTSESNDIRPTLFDFLGHRALDFAKSSSFAVPGPAETFVIEDEKYFGSNSTFLELNPETTDSLNTSFYAVRMFQELTRFHLEKNNVPALIAIELERLKYLQTKSVLPNNDELFYASLQRLTQAYKESPYVSEVWYELANYHFNLGNNYNHLADTSRRWDKKIAAEICQKTSDQFGYAHGAQMCDALLSTLTQKELVLQGEEAIIPNRNSKVLLQYKNIDKVYIKIVSANYKKYNENKFDHGKLVEKLRKKKGIFEKEYLLADPGDLQLHTTELLIPNLEAGFYFIVVGTDLQFRDEKNAFAFTPLWVSNVTYQTREAGDKTQVLVSNRSTGAPLVGAKAEVTRQEYDYKTGRYENRLVGNFTVDEKGFFDFGKSNDYGTYKITVTHGKDVYAPNQGNYGYYYYDDNYDKAQTHFFTDRKIYRPGQTIYFKGISVDYKGKERTLIKNQTTTVKLVDANYQEVATKEVKTNQFGSFEGTFTVPFGVLTGNMTLSNYDNSYTYGSTYFKVEEYKRPKFNVEMKPVEGEIMVNDQVTLVGTAQAFAGNKIDGAKVKYRITRTTGYHWTYYSYWHWQPYYQPKEIQNGELITDENGEFKVVFAALPDKTVDPSTLPLFTYTIYVDVTDINGETHSTSSSIVVGYQSLQLGNNLQADMNNEEDYFLRLTSTNLNGQDIPASGKIIVSKLKSPERPYYSRLWQRPDAQRYKEKEFRELFPLDEYKDENDFYTWEKDKRVFEAAFDTKITDSIAIENYKTWEPGIYLYEAFAKDKNGIDVKDSYYFTVYNPDSKVAAKNEVLWVKNVQSIAEPGETVDFLVATKEKDVDVLYDLVVNGAIVETKRMLLSNEQIKLSFPVKEEYRGNFSVNFSTIKNNRRFNQSITVTVPYTNKELDLKFSSFRNKLLPGADEEWTLTIKNKKGEKEVAELLATLYDASLDELYTPNSFYMSIYETYYAGAIWEEPSGMRASYAYNVNYYWNDYVYFPYRYFPTLNYHGFNSYYYGRNYYYDYGDDYSYSHDLAPDAEYAESPTEERNERKNELKEKDLEKSTVGWSNNQVNATGNISAPTSTLYDATLASVDQPTGGEFNTDTRGRMDNVDLSNISARANFNETAFFYPQLTTDANGDVKIKFTIPESLTKWRFLGLAHTQDLKIGTIQEEVVTQKDLMVVPNAPRFLREGDKIIISAKVSNVSKENLAGRIQLDLIDPFSEKSLNENFKLKITQLDFKADAGKSTVVSWSIDVPYQLSAVKYKIVAASGNFSDGEENVLPILSNRMLVTESMPMPVRGNETKSFSFEKLKNSNKSKTLKHHRYTLEFTSNPAWYAVQAMPYMMEYPYECAEQTFTRYYSNAIASHIMNSNPKIKKVIDEWGDDSPEAFLSNLQKNQELKELMLQETPWVLDAKSEEQSKRNLSVLLDMNRMSQELDKALTKTMKAQTINGGWPWFPGMPESRYITQHIVSGMGHLDHLGVKDVKENHKVWQMVKGGVNYLDKEIVKDYKAAKKVPGYLTLQLIGYDQIQYLYSRSYFPQIDMNAETKEAVGYYKDQATKFWLNFNIYAEGMIALAAHRFDMKELSTDIVKSLKDRSIQHEEFGMYWKDYQAGFYWYEAPIETQALMIEMFNDVTNDQEAVEELKIWLLKQKQTTNWKTTKQTTEAVYALLLTGSDLLSNDTPAEITIGGKQIEYVSNPNSENPYQVKAQAGTGYFKTAWVEEQVKPEMSEITVKKVNKGIAWGAAYWQYFEDLDKITFAETPLSLKKQLFTVEISNQGEQLKPISANNVLQVGDKIRVRIELRTDRNLEYVHMKDMRASGFEPINVLSTYKYQDGLGYYEATKDAATNFFFDYIPKGTYVFEYDLRVQHKGDFSNGITTIQCMYAPEFTSHSEGIRVLVQ